MANDLFEGMPSGTAPPRDLLAGTDAAPSPASTLGYIGSKLLGGFLEGGRQMGAAASTEMGQPAQADQMQSMPTGDQTANQAIYGSPEVAPPNTVARYAGSLAGAVGANPVMAAVAPGITAASSLGGEGGSDINKATGSYLPDWAARLVGGTAGGGVYGAGKSVATSAFGGGDAVINRGQDIINRIKGGEGRLGQYQTLATKAADELQQASAHMPQLPPDHVLPVTNTRQLLDSPAGQFMPNTDGIRKIIADDGGSMFYGDLAQLKDQAGAAGNSALYNALKADHRAALVEARGPAASDAFDKANAARQALYLLRKSVDPSGLYNPLTFTRKMAVGPGGEIVANATPATAALTDKASELYDAVSPLARANTPRPSMMRRLPAAAVAMAADKAGVPGGEMLAGMILGQHGTAAPNPLYQLPSQFGTGLLGSPVAAAAGMSLLNPQNRPSGLLGR